MLLRFIYLMQSIYLYKNCFVIHKWEKHTFAKYHVFYFMNLLWKLTKKTLVSTKTRSFSVQMFYNWNTFDNFKQVCFCFVVGLLFLFPSPLHSRPTAEKRNDVFIIIIIYLMQKKWTDVAVYLFLLFMYLMWQLSLVSR